jgi:hypothetical protein
MEQVPETPKNRGFEICTCWLGGKSIDSELFILEGKKGKLGRKWGKREVGVGDWERKEKKGKKGKKIGKKGKINYKLGTL